MPPRKPLRPKTRDGFEIAIICALPLEADAVITLFDYHWDEEYDFGKARGDPNAYSTGTIGRYNVVLAHLPGMGKVAAGNIAAFCRMSYPNINLALVVGICGGAPLYNKEQILLGDVIISTGVVQYDIGRRLPDKFEVKDTLDESLGRPGLEVRSLLSKLKTKRHHGRLQVATQSHLKQFLEEPENRISYPERSQDVLFPAKYRHRHQESSVCTICATCDGKMDPVCKDATKLSCEELKCDLKQRLIRSRPAEVKDNTKKDNEGMLCPMIHFGVFASGDMVMKSGEDRDHFTNSMGAIGFEMESVGVWEIFPCIVIKGVSDYADSHKNDNWQEYAAASAAACTKAFLTFWDSAAHEAQSKVEEERQLRQSLLASMHFQEMKERENNISPKTPSTFQWIFGTHARESDGQSYVSDASSDFKSFNIPNDDDKSVSWSQVEDTWDSFTDWMVSDQPIYWISGKPGSGKSTLMKYLSTNPRTFEYLAGTGKNTIILSHFFWKPGTRMQQSFKGLLCSLLYDLLSKDSSYSIKLAHDIFTETHKASPSDWSQHELRTILLDYCEQSSQPLYLFVDGLDEAFPDQNILEILSLIKVLASASTKVCVSSRPERLFRLHFESCPNLRMHELTQLDIRKYSEYAMKRSTLLKPEGQNISDLAIQVAKSAHGIFLWAVLATHSLIRGINNGDSKDQTSMRLKSMPQDLMGLYRDILSRLAADRPIYQAYVSLTLNLLVLAKPWEGPLPLTPFMLAMAMDPELLDRYVVHGDRIPKHELEVKVKVMNDTLEAGCAGLLEVKYDEELKTKAVFFLHRSAREFLLDTVEGRSLWQPCDVPEKELWVRHFKSLIAENRFSSEFSQVTRVEDLGVRHLLREIHDWEEDRGYTPDITASFLELAGSCFRRGLLFRGTTDVVTLNPGSADSQFLLDTAYGQHFQHARELLDKLGDNAQESGYCLLFDLCAFRRLEAGQRWLVQYMLDKGYNPNWRIVNTPTTTGTRLLGCPWFNFLVTALNDPRYFFGGVESSEQTTLVSEIISMFLRAGASMETRFPVVLEIATFTHAIFGMGLANTKASRPNPTGVLLPQFIVFEANAKALVDLIMRSSNYASQETHSPTRPDFRGVRPHLKPLAFTNRTDLVLSIIQNTVLSDEFSEMFVTILNTLFSYLVCRDGELRRKFASILQSFMTICGPLCPLATDGYYWQGVLVQVSSTL